MAKTIKVPETNIFICSYCGKACSELTETKKKTFTVLHCGGCKQFVGRLYERALTTEEIAEVERELKKKYLVS
jgi:flavoprotein